MNIPERDRLTPAHQEEARKISRRDFLKLAATLVGGTFVAAACKGKEIPPTPEQKFQLLWEIPLVTDLVIDNEAVFLTAAQYPTKIWEGHKLMRVNAEDGTIEWEWGSEEKIVGAKDQSLFLLSFEKSKESSESYNYRLVALDTKTGGLKWQDSVMSRPNWWTTEVFFHKNKVFLDGCRVLDLETGEFLLATDFRLELGELEDEENWVTTKHVERTEGGWESRFFNLDSLTFLDLLPPYEKNRFAFRVKDNIALFDSYDSYSKFGVMELFFRNTKIGAFDAKTGKELWSHNGFKFVKLIGSVAIAEKEIDRDWPDDWRKFYIQYAQLDKIYAAFDIKSGEKLWEQKFEKDARFEGDEDNFYVIQTLGRRSMFSSQVVQDINVIKINPETGKRLWDTKVEGEVWGGWSYVPPEEIAVSLSIGAEYALAWMDNQLLVIASRDDVFVIDARDGKLIDKAAFVWSLGSEALRSSTVQEHRVTADDQNVYLAFQDHLFVLNRSTGTLRLENYHEQYPVKEYESLESIRERRDASYRREKILQIEKLNDLLFERVYIGGGWDGYEKLGRRTLRCYRVR